MMGIGSPTLVMIFLLKTMVNCGVFDKVGCQIGVGKESGIFPYFVMQNTVWKNTVLLFQNAVAYDRHCVIMSLFQGHPL